jgi:ABC-type sulfate transport system permease component
MISTAAVRAALIALSSSFCINSGIRLSRVIGRADSRGRVLADALEELPYEIPAALAQAVI